MDRTATAVWKGNLKEGKGTLDSQSGTLKGTPYSFKARFEDESGKSGTNPEELIAAAHASCFCMALSHGLTQKGTPPTRLEVTAVATFVPGQGFTKEHLTVKGTVPGIDQAAFLEAANGAKENCPISKALKGNVEVTMDAALA